LLVETAALPSFLLLLQNGFLLTAQVGCSIGQFLRDQCRMAHETVAGRISTVFLDGMPVDDIDRAVIRNGSTLALSGAMPGLVGAAMRSRSPLASFRGSITYRGDEIPVRPQHGMIRLKLFNVAMRELGPEFLRQGILLDAPVLRGFFSSQSEADRAGYRAVFLNGEPIDIGFLRDESFQSQSELVFLSVEACA
jgi:hypothetical protein